MVHCVYYMYMVYFQQCPFSVSPPGADQPSLKLLLKFPSKGINIDLISKISCKYHKLGLWLLGEENVEKIESLEIQHHYNVERITTEIFKMWIRGTGRKPISWDTLIQVLQDADLHNLADELLDAFK